MSLNDWFERERIRQDYKNDPDYQNPEIVLAACIQEAKARGLKRARRNYFTKADGKPAYQDSPNIAACCALGAARLALLDHMVPAGVVQGNDGKAPEPGDLVTPEGYAFGRAFYHAMGED